MNGKRWGVLIFVVVLVGLAAIAMVATASESEGKAFLGIVPGEVTSDLASEYGVVGGGGNGVIVEGVSSDTPAEKAGLRENDIILKLNNNSITGPREFRNLLAKLKPNDSVELVYLRAGKTKTVNVKLGEREEHTFNIPGLGKHDIHVEGDPWTWSESKSDKETRKVAFAGIVTQGLSDGLAAYFKVEKGALISEVVKGSPAEKSGLRAGDVVTKIGDDAIEDEDDVRSAIHDRKPGDGTEFTIKRDGQEMKITVTLGEQADAGFKRFIRIGSSDDESGYMLTPEAEDMQALKESLNNLKFELKDIDAKDLNLDELHESLKQLSIELRGVSDSTVQELKKLDIPNLKIKFKKAEPTEAPKKTSSHLRLQVMGTYV
jgi:C-terminal processing protease CtpA/Prc